MSSERPSPKTEAGKNRSPRNAIMLRTECYGFFQPSNSPERDLVAEMVNSKCLENSTLSHQMDEQTTVFAARHTRLIEPSRTAIACPTHYDNCPALHHIQRSKARNSRVHHRGFNKLHHPRRDPFCENEQSNLVPNPDTPPNRCQKARHRLTSLCQSSIMKQDCSGLDY